MASKQLEVKRQHVLHHDENEARVEKSCPSVALSLHNTIAHTERLNRIPADAEHTMLWEASQIMMIAKVRDRHAADFTTVFRPEWILRRHRLVGMVNLF